MGAEPEVIAAAILPAPSVVVHQSADDLKIISVIGDGPHRGAEFVIRPRTHGGPPGDVDAVRENRLALERLADYTDRRRIHRIAALVEQRFKRQASRYVVGRYQDSDRGRSMEALFSRRGCRLHNYTQHDSSATWVKL